MNSIELQQEVASEAMAELPPKYRELATLTRIRNAVNCATLAMPSKLAAGATGSPRRKASREEATRAALKAAAELEEKPAGFGIVVSWLIGFAARRAISFVINWLVRRAISKLWQRYFPGDVTDDRDPDVVVDSWDGRTDLSGDAKGF